MFAWLAGLAVAVLWRRSERATLWLPAPQAARWGGFAAAFGYALFSGWGVPSQRTVWMLATITVLQTLGVRWPWLLVLLLAAVVVTALDPWALLQAGFWLSFVAVGLLMASAPASAMAPQTDARQVPGWRGWTLRFFATVNHGLRTQAIATLGLTPLTLVFFQQVSLVGFAANLVAIVAVVAGRLGRAAAAWSSRLAGGAAGGCVGRTGGAAVGAARRACRRGAAGAAVAVARPLVGRTAGVAPAPSAASCASGRSI
jgi:competence protein ComEC